MRGKQSLCLLCRISASSKTSPNSYGIQRFASSRRREPYVLSRLVIDLDAADSKYVKRVEDLEPKKEEQTAPRRITENSPSETSLETKNVKKQRPKRVFNEHRITPHDLLSYAFLGDINPEDRHHPELKAINRYNDVLPMDNLGTKFDQLISRFSRDTSRNLELAGFNEINEINIAAQFASYSMFWRLRRVVSLLSSTNEGCKFLISHESSLLYAIGLCCKIRDAGIVSGPSITDEKILRMLNNLSINIKSRGLKQGLNLSKKGYATAVSLCNPSSMRLHAEVSASFGKILHPHHGMSLGRTLKYHGVKDDIITDEIRNHYIGKSIKAIDQDSKKRAFISKIDHERQKDLIGYPMFLCVLGSLGLKGQLWREWIASENKAAHPQINGNVALNFRAQIFATAFVLARDIDRARAVLDSVPERERANTIYNTEMIPAGQGIFKMVSNSSENPSLRFRMYTLFKCYYACHNLSMGSKLQRALWYALGDMPTDSGEALEVIEKFLPTASHNGLAPNTPFKFKAKIEWAELNGKQGLLVTDFSDTGMYWKAASKEADVVDLGSSVDV